MTREFHQIAWDPQLEADWLRLLELAVEEDLGRQGDCTTLALVPADAPGRAAVVARQSGVIAGLAAVESTLRRFDPRLRWSPETQDGASVPPNARLGSIEGPARGILAAERVLLNLLGRLSGVATLTRRVCRGGGRHEGANLRHPQNHARLAATGKIRRPLRRRLEPSHRAVRGRADQRQPPGTMDSDGRRGKRD